MGFNPTAIALGTLCADKQRPARPDGRIWRRPPAHAWGFVGALEFYPSAASRWAAAADSGVPPRPRAVHSRSISDESVG